MKDRLFIGTFPTGISYADRTRERDGDYMRLAFLPFNSLTLEWSKAKISPALRDAIIKHAISVMKSRGKPYQVSSSGQTVDLGRDKTSAQLDQEIAALLAKGGK